MGDSETKRVGSHPYEHGQVFFSPGCHFSYRVVGPCCRLFDREQLPWPCCRLQWRGKEPSWRRIGRRFVVDLATKGHPSYSVEIIGQRSLEPIVITLYSVKLSQPVQAWWHAERRDKAENEGWETEEHAAATSEQPTIGLASDH